MDNTMLGKWVTLAMTIPDGMYGILSGLVEKLVSRRGSDWHTELRKFCRREQCWTLRVQASDFIRRLFEYEEITIGVTQGTETLDSPDDVFDVINPSYRRDRLDVPGRQALPIVVRIWEVVKDANTLEVCGNLGNLDRICLTQGQIKAFVRDHRDKLPKAEHPGPFGSTITCFFFTERDEPPNEDFSNLFMLAVWLDVENKVHAVMHPYGQRSPWYAPFKPRIVFPA